MSRPLQVRHLQPVAFRNNQPRRGRYHRIDLLTYGAAALKWRATRSASPRPDGPPVWEHRRAGRNPARPGPVLCTRDAKLPLYSRCDPSCSSPRPRKPCLQQKRLPRVLEQTAADQSDGARRAGNTVEKYLAKGYSHSAAPGWDFVPGAVNALPAVIPMRRWTRDSGRVSRFRQQYPFFSETVRKRRF